MKAAVPYAVWYGRLFRVDHVLVLRLYTWRVVVGTAPPLAVDIPPTTYSRPPPAAAPIQARGERIAAFVLQVLAEVAAVASSAPAIGALNSEGGAVGSLHAANMPLVRDRITSFFNDIKQLQFSTARAWTAGGAERS